MLLQTLENLNRDLLRELGNKQMHRENRLLNRVADKLAKNGRRKETPPFFEEWTVPPLFIWKFLSLDKGGTPFERQCVPDVNTIWTNVSCFKQYAGSSSYVSSSSSSIEQAPQPCVLYDVQAKQYYYY
ncbi:hypothetical protein P3L10_020992 [Capsicum annuum]|uniref:uncharacterized protein LOC124900056 n=1 Tax=Capsicum annuum TaxID=4072 RepID=UPI001FB05DD0|nr:uncharacterized protein LOC124900056 [Capsicum annuum]